MLSLLIETRNDEEALARTLSSLIPAVVEGLVREAIVCDLASADGVRRVADQAGCCYLDEGGVSDGVSRARSDWLLMLEPGARLVDGWGESVAAHLAENSGPGRFTRSAGGEGTFLARLFPRRRPLADGLVITTRQALSLSRPGIDASALASGVSPRRLAGRIVPAARKR